MQGLTLVAECYANSVMGFFPPRHTRSPHKDPEAPVKAPPVLRGFFFVGAGGTTFAISVRVTVDSALNVWP